ncbi:alpha/beta hydrolase [Pleomorphovibrio marinus]|uniref:alpha/beta hydrolase n=1 Tax=Pleomorphovibrio marinus TaxID=2164132 RepID=UPI000E0AB068|nr:alpha/beta hydrolase-fold protein [Pleomorphovibrio marinus]
MTTFQFLLKRNFPALIGNWVLLFCLLGGLSPLQASAQDRGSISDHIYYSEAFGESRNFRVILPPSYESSEETRYPVVYFMHGWSERYFGSLTREPKEDDAISLDDSLSLLAAKHNLVIIKSDGYNADQDAPYYLRPYNIGPVETFRQFPLYIPELVKYVDTHFKTSPIREDRAVSGFSMGGFMSLWLGGKYPHLFSAVGAFCASPEFVIGPRDFPVEYFHANMYGNFENTRVRHHYGDQDFIRAYHKDVNAVWDKAMQHYSWKEYGASHEVCGKADMFAFFSNHFKNPLPSTPIWHHIDVYPNFEVRGYAVYSDRDLPGFTSLENVSKNGFRSSVKSFLPNGETMPFVHLKIHTAPVYKEGHPYLIQVFNLAEDKPLPDIQEITAGINGRISIELDGGLREIFITDAAERRSELTLLNATVDNHKWAVNQRVHTFRLSLLNKGNLQAEGIKLLLQSRNPKLRIRQSHVELESLGSGQQRVLSGTFEWESQEEGSTFETLELHMEDREGQEWNYTIPMPIYTDSELPKPTMIADGKEVTYLTKGNQVTTGTLGIGNGDGIANPGESIVMLAKDRDNWRPLHLHTSDNRVDIWGGSTRHSDYWGSFDHVGGSFKFTEPLILSKMNFSEDLAFVGTYWGADYPDHPIYSGVVNLTIEGDDSTAPQVAWVKGDRNIIKASLYDGGEIKQVKAKLIPLDKNGQTMELEMKDNGKDADRIKGDGVFSVRVEVSTFGEYELFIRAEDEFGNQGEHKVKDNVRLHGTKRYHY